MEADRAGGLWKVGSGRTDGRQVSEQGTGTVPKPGSAGPQSSWQHPEEMTAQEVKCRSPIFELSLWITEFTSLWPESEAAAWKSPVLWHSHNPVQVELQVLIYKTKRWGRGGTNTASSKEQNIGVSPNLCSVPLGTQSFQGGRAFQRHLGCTRRALEHWNPFVCFSGQLLVRIGWGFPRNISDNWSRWDWGSLRSWGSCRELGLDWLPEVWKTHCV